MVEDGETELPELSEGACVIGGGSGWPIDDKAPTGSWLRGCPLNAEFDTPKGRARVYGEFGWNGGLSKWEFVINTAQYIDRPRDASISADIAMLRESFSRYFEKNVLPCLKER